MVVWKYFFLNRKRALSPILEFHTEEAKWAVDFENIKKMNPNHRIVFMSYGSFIMFSWCWTMIHSTFLHAITIFSDYDCIKPLNQPMAFIQFYLGRKMPRLEGSTFHHALPVVKLQQTSRRRNDVYCNVSPLNSVSLGGQPGPGKRPQPWHVPKSSEKIGTEDEL